MSKKYLEQALNLQNLAELLNDQGKFLKIYDTEEEEWFECSISEFLKGLSLALLDKEISSNIN